MFQFPTIGSLPLPRNYKLCVRMHRMDRTRWHVAERNDAPIRTPKRAAVSAARWNSVPILLIIVENRATAPFRRANRLVQCRYSSFPDARYFHLAKTNRGFLIEIPNQNLLRLFIYPISRNLFRVISVSSIRGSYIDNKNSLSKCINMKYRQRANRS